MEIKNFNQFDKINESNDTLEVREIKKYLNGLNSVFTYDWLNEQNEGNLYRTAIYQNLYLIDLINRKYDGVLMSEKEYDDEHIKVLKNMYEKTTKDTIELEDFFIDIRNRNKK